jgi:hypothetical protein
MPIEIHTPAEHLHSDHRCTATTYCRINGTRTVQTGSGKTRKCPVCGALYQEQVGKSEGKRTQPAKNQAAIDAFYKKMRQTVPNSNRQKQNKPVSTP